MANNIDFITSLDREKDFESLIKRVVEHIYEAEVYLVGGPYDGGRDLLYKKDGKEIRECVQISIQEKGLDAKIIADAEKARELSDKLDYPRILTMFSSQKLSASRKAKLKKSARDLHDIGLEIYDATEIEQIISDDAPEILEFLIRDLHGFKAKSSSTDPKARAFYDFLALGKDANQLKSSIVDAQILSILFNEEKSKTDVLEELSSSGVKVGVAESRISHLLAKKKIVKIDDDLLSLDAKEALRIDSILLKDEKAKKHLLQILQEYTIKIVGLDLSVETLDIIKQVYSASVDIQITEMSFEPPRLIQVKELVKKLEYLLTTKGMLGIDGARSAAKELIELSSKNEYLSNQCSSLLCLNLLKQRKLEKYINERYFFVYLDAPVFIRYVALYGFRRKSYLDREMRTTQSLVEAFRSLENCRVSVTAEHLEETVRHITQAQKISDFANDELIQRFGQSKNVFFNLYLAEKSQRRNYTFDDFLEDLIGFDAQGQRHEFEEFRRCVVRFNKIAGVFVENFDTNIEEVPAAKRVVALYDDWTTQVHKPRRHRAIWNDMFACYILSDDHRHLDEKGYGHAPMLITWDSTQHKLRELYRDEFRFADWMIYSPQRAIERFSMVSFDASSIAMKDSVLAILDEDYTKESSLIDILSGFFGSDKIETDSIISLITKLSGRLHDEASEVTDYEANERSVISEALLTIQNSFRNKFDDVRKLFADPDKENLIIDILSKYSMDVMTGEQLTAEFDKLLLLR